MNSFLFFHSVYRSTLKPQRWCHCIWLGLHGPYFFPDKGFLGVYVSSFGAGRRLLDVSLIHFVVSLLSKLNISLGLADQRAHASTFECVQLCSEYKM